jgi:hypothetical protein
MAAEDLLAALQGLKYAPIESPYGIAGASLAQSMPQMITPTMSTGKALGLSLGGVLLSGLLGYQARRDAAAANLESAKLGLQLQSAMTPEARLGIIEQAGGGTMGDLQSRLLDVNNVLLAQDLDTQNAIKRASGLETGKMKALQEFYNTPEGIAQREFEIKKIKEEAAARRTPMEDWMAQQAILQGNRKSLKELDIEGRRQIKELDIAASKELQGIKDAAASGRQDKQQAWKEKVTNAQQAFDKEMIKYRADVGVEAAKDKAEQLAALEMDLIQQNIDPDVARTQARLAMTADLQKDYLQAREESQIRLLDKARTEREKEANFKKQLDLEAPTVPAALRTQSVKRVSVADSALELANDIEKYHNWVTYRIGTKFTAADEALLRSRLKKLTAEERLALTGTASNESERADIDQMINGDFTSGPEAKAALLRRFANDEKRMAISNMKGGSQSVGSFVSAVEQSLANNSLVNFEIPQVGGGTQQAAEIFVNELQKKYGADWKVKMTPAEKTAAAALLQARGK